MKFYIRAQSKKQSDVLANLEEHTKACMEHLAKLWIFPDSTSKQHWRREIWSYYSSVSRVKPRNKLVSAQKILDNTWNLHSHQVHSMINHAIEHEYALNPNIARKDDEESLYQIMEQYFIWIAENLSQKDNIDPQECYEELSSLGL